ncbi:D-methionine-binding lipoprotein metQ precursor [Aedoeadaptatus ivorii]|uniref:Lipoprotein n=1 Tax=Aedoeadaptatus ivorii TaxID=54006 RepID=A0A3S5AK88_9FIRM|nr:MetQ/NlpA family ABC transporter substrate-binding protein [Peptoniphilus ivorii]MDQ0508681.1 D-methionine transport system substrate-binding protein [Peptoniphilus ivorii]VEJ36192.1 D-methionine-binding lipoprotein metQ precursor [Peptoniphilus ivorii]
MKHLWKKITAIALLSALVLTGCAGGEKKADGGAQDTVKIGVVGDDQRLWEKAAETAKEDGVTLDIVVFNDYNTPNDALANGELDLNAFQHKAFLDAYNKDKNTDLVPIGMTYLSPIGVYSEKIKDLKDLAENAKVAIPNDTTNGGRALLVLEQAGVIQLKDDAGLTPAIGDVAENPKNIQIEELDAAQVARSLPDVDAAVINGNMAVDAGLDPRKDTIYVEEMSENIAPYINYVVARAEDKDNELYKKVVGYYQTDEVDELLQELYKGSQYAAWKLDLENLAQYEDGKTEAK